MWNEKWHIWLSVVMFASFKEQIKLRVTKFQSISGGSHTPSKLSLKLQHEITRHCRWQEHNEYLRRFCVYYFTAPRFFLFILLINFPLLIWKLNILWQIDDAVVHLAWLFNSLHFQALKRSCRFLIIFIHSYIWI